MGGADACACEGDGDLDLDRDLVSSCCCCSVASSAADAARDDLLGTGLIRRDPALSGTAVLIRAYMGLGLNACVLITLNYPVCSGFFYGGFY